MERRIKAGFWSGTDRWGLWLNRSGQVKGIAILHPASDYGLQLHCDLRDDMARREYCQRLLDKLNAPDSASCRTPEQP